MKQITLLQLADLKRQASHNMRDCEDDCERAYYEGQVTMLQMLIAGMVEDDND